MNILPIQLSTFPLNGRTIRLTSTSLEGPIYFWMPKPFNKHNHKVSTVVTIWWMYHCTSIVYTRCPSDAAITADWLTCMQRWVDAMIMICRTLLWTLKFLGEQWNSPPLFLCICWHHINANSLPPLICRFKLCLYLHYTSFLLVRAINIFPHGANSLLTVSSISLTLAATALVTLRWWTRHGWLGGERQAERRGEIHYNQLMEECRMGWVEKRERWLSKCQPLSSLVVHKGDTLNK